ncbi:MULTISPECIES: 3-deoxy-manno-octulosonate cytidylyltransferase [unclassified Rhizobium]|uniref:3-deoxy-manno-octulosonate cytidylyltransferase n=1 Tax=Rhizobium TaxID=379 RepID=UPI00159F2207|nr:MULTISPECIES: 3-deoxy-manno-octulosonate cytidylyltransferase [unclassified Rhizobium]QYA12101.1 3-deoxy-manno-octulosonate cytidylyltransferase [Rhizobium sp. AB2/73]UEQ81968.1 3-deoxy-manno-octulosonate cytidylyltransferase [Rhizobium sp. AB2/73]
MDHKTTGNIEVGIPAAGSAAGLSSTDEWRAILMGFSHIVLVANSDAVDISSLQAQFPETALFVFFNKVYKVLDRPFHGHSLLISRGQPRGANIVYRGEVGEVIKFFPKEYFLGIMNIRLGPEEKLNPATDFQGAPTGHLDLVGFCSDFYKEGKTPTSGFAMALWLSDLKLPGKIVLAGFSARRSQKWRVVSAHDWSFEQTFLRLFARLGKITIHGGVALNPYISLAQRFTEVPPAEIALAAAEVLSERLGNTDAEIDKLISLTNVIRSADNFMRRLKPKFLKRKPKGSPGEQ